jgi:hypothetical protein
MPKTRKLQDLNVKLPINELTKILGKNKIKYSIEESEFKPPFFRDVELHIDQTYALEDILSILPRKLGLQISEDQSTRSYIEIENIYNEVMGNNLQGVKYRTLTKEEASNLPPNPMGFPKERIRIVRTD